MDGFERVVYQSLGERQEPGPLLVAVPAGEPWGGREAMRRADPEPAAGGHLGFLPWPPVTLCPPGGCMSSFGLCEYWVPGVPRAVGQESGRLPGKHLGSWRSPKVGTGVAMTPFLGDLCCQASGSQCAWHLPLVALRHTAAARSPPALGRVGLGAQAAPGPCVCFSFLRGGSETEGTC